MIFAKGDKVKHQNWGVGRVLEDADSDKVRVNFKRSGEKLLTLKHTNLVKIYDDELSGDESKYNIPRRPLHSEIQLLKNFLYGSESVSSADKRYLIFFKEQLLKSLYEKSEVIGNAPTIKSPNFTPWLQFISTGTNDPQFSEERLAKFQELERKRLLRHLNDKDEYEIIINEIADEVERQRENIARLINGLEEQVNEKIILKPIKLQWKLMLQGETTLARIIAHFEQISRYRSDIVVDIDRLNKVYSLNPDLIYMGTDEFEGYLVFYFPKVSKAVLECAVSGNAIYVIKENWEELSRLSKFELLNYHRNKVARVIHKGAWFRHLKTILYDHPVQQEVGVS